MDHHSEIIMYNVCSSLLHGIQINGENTVYWGSLDIHLHEKRLSLNCDKVKRLIQFICFINNILDLAILCIF